jgi:hypothetical protein
MLSGDIAAPDDRLGCDRFPMGEIQESDLYNGEKARNRGAPGDNDEEPYSADAEVLDGVREPLEISGFVCQNTCYSQIGEAESISFISFISCGRGAFGRFAGDEGVEGDPHSPSRFGKTCISAGEFDTISM